MALLALIVILPQWLFAGRILTGKLMRDSCDHMKDSVAFAVGMAFLSCLVTALSAAGRIHRADLALLVIVPFLVTAKHAAAELKTIRPRFEKLMGELSGRRDRLLLVLVAVLTILDLVNCGNAAVGWDAAVHHYAFPRSILDAGRLIDVPGIPFSYYPSLVEMLFLFGLGVGGVFLAGAFTWAFLFPLFGAMLSLGKSAGSARIGLWGLVILLGAPLTFELPFSGVVDLPFLTYCTLAAALLFESKKKLSCGKLALIGVLTGCACATKHLGLLFLAAFLPILTWRVAAITRRASDTIVAALIVILVSLAVPSPWYIRSYVLTGDPLFPFLTGMFKSAGASFSLESFTRTDYPRNLWGYVVYLWHLTMDYWDHRPWFLAIHPAWLAFLPFALAWSVLERQREETFSIRMILVLGIVSLTVNFFLAPAYPRYLFPTWALFSVVSAWALSVAANRWPAFERALLPIALVLPFALVLSMAAKRSLEVIPQYFSREAGIQAVERAYPGYQTFVWANTHLNRRTTKILTTDPKVYYLDSPAIVCKPGIESRLLVPWDSEPEQILENWRQLGITHFLLDTTLLSVKHGFGIAYFTDILRGQDAVWLDIDNTRAGARAYGIEGILSDEDFFHLSDLAQLPVVMDGQIERHLLNREKILRFQTLGRDWKMARLVLQMIQAGILKEEIRSGPGGGVRLYSVHFPEEGTLNLPEPPDLSMYYLPYDRWPAI